MYSSGALQPSRPDSRAVLRNRSCGLPLKRSRHQLGRLDPPGGARHVAQPRHLGFAAAAEQDHPTCPRCTARRASVHVVARRNRVYICTQAIIDITMQ